MPLFDYPELVFTQLALIALSALWMLRRNDELPLLISCFTCYISSYRYWAVTSGYGYWVNIINFGFDPITNEVALSALSYITFGEICLLAAYMLQQKHSLPIITPFTDYTFQTWLRPKALFLGLLCLPLVILVRGQLVARINAGQSVAFGGSYLFLFPMLLLGVATLIFCLWKFGGLPARQHKLFALLILGGVTHLTYNPTTRFQFLAWIIAGGIILSCSYRARTRLIIFAITAVLALSLFAVAGASRNIALSSDTLNDAAVERAFSAEDANMLDGFVLMQQIYPERLDYTFGMGHLEILMRPIPRAIWPEKPVGGYMNKLGLTLKGGGTLGISQSLFGSFYEEGGIFGIAVLSILYGRILAKIVGHSAKLQPFASIMVRAILCACLVPLLRGGDLPGIYAWFGMAFWPCFLLLWVKRHYFDLQFYLSQYSYYLTEDYLAESAAYLETPHSNHQDG